MNLHCGVFVLLFPLLALLSQGEVTTFQKCSQFFLNGVTPTIVGDAKDNNRYQQICQCLLDENDQPKYFYATLYDTKNKIPVYSAYVLQHAGQTGRCDAWYIEPQLDGVGQICMGPEGVVKLKGTNQALNKDYEGSNLHKGHLYPVHHTSNAFNMLATSTLTNAAPQDPTFNIGSWKTHEGDLAELLEKTCSGHRAFVVTGVVPDPNIVIPGGVRVARYYWSAYCCTGINGPLGSAGYIGPDNNGKVQTLTVAVLETRLSGVGYYNTPFSVFRGRCH